MKIQSTSAMKRHTIRMIKQYYFLCIIIKVLQISTMFINEVAVIGEEYARLATRYPNLKQLCCSISVQSLIFKSILHYANYQSQIDIHELFSKTKSNKFEWMYAINVILKEIYQEIMWGPSVAYREPIDKPNNIIKQLKLAYQPLKPEHVEYKEYIQKYQIQHLVPKYINIYTVEYLRSKPFAFRNKYYLKQQLSLEGQSWIDVVPYPHLLLVLIQVTDQMCEDKEYNINYKNLLQARLAYLHNQILFNPVGALSKKVITGYRSYLSQYSKMTVALEHFIAIKLEFSNALLFYYKYVEAERNLEVCKEVLDIEIEYTGKLGRRTKYQTFDVSQLVMDIKKYEPKNQSEHQGLDQQIIQEEKINLPKIQQVLVINNEEKEGPKILDLEEDSILYEIPKFSESFDVQTSFSVEKQLTILSSAFLMYMTSPKQQSLFLKISSIVAPLLTAKPTPPYSIRYALLILRSLNQLPRMKNSDRAIEQLQQLIAEYNTIKKSQQDILYILSTPAAYTIHILFMKVVGEALMKYGLVMTGVEMYQKVGLYQEAVEGLIRVGHKDRAMKLAKELLALPGGQKNARVICLLADIDHNIAGYQRAWEVSGEKYARAQKQLGWIYFHKKEFEKSATAYKKSLDINYYNPNSWFTLGCAYMNLKRFDQAIKAFSQSVCIDESQGEAWGNLASCYIISKKFNQAYTTLQQAVKYCESNWKIWANLLSTSLKIKKFYKYFECIEKLARLEHEELLTYDVMSKVTQILKYKLDCFEQDRKRILLAYLNRIDRMYQMLRQKLGQKPAVWKYYCEYLEIKLEYLKKFEVHYLKLHKECTIDVNDLIPEYKLESYVRIYTKEESHRIKVLLRDAKQKQCNMLMVVGWEADKKQSEILVVAVQELIQLYKSSGNQDDKELVMFVKSINNKILKTLERQIQI